MKTNNKTTEAIRPMGASLLAAAMGAALLLVGCAGGGGTNSTVATTWPSVTPPATTQANTYIGTESPGLVSVSIDHTANSFSYQNLSTSGQPVVGTFTTSNGFLNLGSNVWAIEMLSRAVIIIPYTGQPVVAINAPTCQIIPSRTPFNFLPTVNLNYLNGVAPVGTGVISPSSSDNGQAWEFGGQVLYGMPVAPDPFNATCASASLGSFSLIQTAITTPSSLPANFAIGPTGFFMEDRYQSDGVAYIGAVRPQAPVDLTQLSGATFLGVIDSVYQPSAFPGQQLLSSFTASTTGSGSNATLQLIGGAFPSNNPASTPAINITINLGTQDPVNYGSFPSATYSKNGFTFTAPAIVTNAGGKYSIFVLARTGSSEIGFLLFQQ